MKQNLIKLKINIYSFSNKYVINFPPYQILGKFLENLIKKKSMFFEIFFLKSIKFKLEF